MGLLERSRANYDRKMREEVIDRTLQDDEKVSLLCLAQWFPKSKLISWIDDNILLLTVGKQYIACLTDKRFLLFEVPKSWKNSFSIATLTLEVPRADVRIKSIGKKEFITHTREVTLMLGTSNEITLKFVPPYTREAEAICAELPHSSRTA